MNFVNILFLLLVQSVVVIIATDREEYRTGNRNVVEVVQDPCNLPAVTGRCYAYFPSFYYNAKEDKCKSFVYGGCGGNSNRFQAKQECEKFRYRCLRKRGQKPHYHRRY